MARGLFNMVGGYSSERVKIYMATEKPLAKVSIAGWAKPIVLGAERKSWLMPLWEKSIPNQARVTITYQNP